MNHTVRRALSHIAFLVLLLTACASNSGRSENVSVNTKVNGFIQPTSVPANAESGEIVDPTMPPPFSNMATATPYFKKDSSLRTQATQFFREWLDDRPCKAPCWQGVTPEVTTGEEALIRLSSQKALEGFTLEQQTVDTRGIVYPDEKSNRARIVFISAEKLTSVGLHMRGRYLTSTVQTALVSIPNGVTLDEAVAKMGKPTHILVEYQDNITIFFKDHGVALISAEGLPVFSKDTRFYRVKFFDSSSTALNEVSDAPVCEEWIRVWNGIKPLQDYYVR